MGCLDLMEEEQDCSCREVAAQVGMEILNAIHSKKFSLLEIRRFKNDLMLAQSRLCSREYRQSNFSPRNMLSIPDRSDEIYKDLRFFWSVAKIWQEIIKNTFKSSYLSVLEIGCGQFSKIGVGLIYSKYLGKLTLLDLDLKACRRAVDTLEYYGAPFHSIVRNASIFSGPREQYDVVLANHFLDDLILSSFCRRNKISMGSLYRSEQLYRQTWNSIIAKPESIGPLIRRLARTLHRATRAKGLIVLVDYPSFSHRSLGLKALICFVKKAQNCLRAELQSLGNIELQALSKDNAKVDRLKVLQGDIVAFRKTNTARSL